MKRAARIAIGILFGAAIALMLLAAVAVAQEPAEREFEDYSECMATAFVGYFESAKSDRLFVDRQMVELFVRMAEGKCAFFADRLAEAWDSADFGVFPKQTIRRMIIDQFSEGVGAGE